MFSTALEQPLHADAGDRVIQTGVPVVSAPDKMTIWHQLRDKGIVPKALMPQVKKSAANVPQEENVPQQAAGGVPLLLAESRRAVQQQQAVELVRDH